MTKEHFDSYASAFIEDVESCLRAEYLGFELSVKKLDWSLDRTRSQGGRYPKGYGISIKMNSYLSWPEGTYRIYEYASYNNHPVIGGFYTRNPLDNLKMTICHEMAHAVQYYLYDKGSPRDSPHGTVFKTVYKSLRAKYVNPYLPDQKMARREYDAFIKEIKKEIL